VTIVVTQAKVPKCSMGCASSAPARLVAEDALTPHGDGKAFSDARSAEPDAGSFAAEPKDCGPNAIAKLADHPQDLALDIAGETPGLQEAHHATSTSFTRCECDGRAGDHDKLSPLSSSPHRKEQQSSSPGAHRVASTATTALGDSDSGELEASFVIDTMTLETRKNDDGVKFINEFEVNIRGPHWVPVLVSLASVAKILGQEMFRAHILSEILRAGITRAWEGGLRKGEKGAGRGR
jgi:hypothetical protein